MNVLFEDEYFLVCEKPTGVLSEPCGNGEDIITLATGLTGSKCFLVHRLDRGTGGAMVLAKTSQAAGALSSLISQRAFSKEYLAVIEGTPAESSGIFKDLLFKDSRKNKSYVVNRIRKGVKEASLEYRTIESIKSPKNDNLSLVLIKLHTGRTHQIRVQFASRKMPLLGDGKYGSHENCCETALWSFRLSFKHPFANETVTAVSLPPASCPWNLFNNISLTD